MLPEEILKKIKMLELSTRKLVNSQLSGEYKTAFKGQGMTFAEFREYVPGDDIRSISWALTARTGKTFIKKFDEERELILMLAVDISGSTDFGSGEFFKGEILVHLAAALAYSAIKNNDQIGLIMFSSEVEVYIPPKKGQAHVQRILRELLFYKPKHHKTNITEVCEFLSKILKKRSVVFLFSDFADANYEKMLRRLGSKHDVTAAIIQDPLELAVPPVGLIDLLDPETQEVITVDSSSKEFQKLFSEHVSEQRGNRDKALKQAQVGIINVFKTENYLDPLVQFFKRRNKR